MDQDKNDISVPLPIPLSSISAPTPEMRRKAKPKERTVRHNCSLKCPPSAVTMCIGALAVPRIPSFEDLPTFLKAERAPILPSSAAELADPDIHERNQVKKIKTGD